MKMKKLFLFFTLLAGIAAMTGCKKDQDVVTLKAVIDQETKAYFGTAVRPYWDDNDKVRVMGGGYRAPLDCDLSDVSETYATIVGVDNSTNNYYAAIFPLEAAEKMYIPETTGTAHAVIYYRPDQVYHEDDIIVDGVSGKRQRVNMIMGAVANNSTKTFHFKNLCSILRLHITNNYDNPVNVNRITIQASGAYVAGSADVTLTPNGTPRVVMDGLHDAADNVLSLYRDGNVGYLKTLTANGTTGSTATIDVVVPPFNATSLNIELELYDANNNFIGNSDAIITDPPELVINEIVDITLSTNHNIEPADYAYIEPGPDFNTHMQQLLATIPNGRVTSFAFDVVGTDERPNVEQGVTVVNVKADHSPFNIWAYLVPLPGTVADYKIQVYCKVPLLYADKNSSHMFEDLEDLQTMNWNNDIRHENGDVESIAGFQTEDVVDMSYMFANCSSLTSVQGANFNTTNVRTMAHMFDGCSSFSSQGNMGGIESFNTHNLQDMEAMFKDCASLGTLDIPNFTTNRVTNMQELFRGCDAMQRLDISRFNMSNVTNKSLMFEEFASGHPYYGAIIHCDNDTWGAISPGTTTGTNLPSNTEHSDPTVSE